MSFFKQEKQRPGDIFRKLNEAKVKIFHEDIINMAKENANFRKEVKTAHNSQVVLMSIEPGESIGQETHKVDQILFFVSGHGKGIINSTKFNIKPNDLVLVPAGSMHNFVNNGTQPLKLFTIYAPPEHKAGTVNKTKADALAKEDSNTVH